MNLYATDFYRDTANPASARSYAILSLQPNLSPTPPAAGAAHGTPRPLVAQHVDLQMGIEVSARQHSVDGNLHSVWAPRFCRWAYRSRGADSLIRIEHTR